MTCQTRVKRQSSGCFSLTYQSAISRHLDTVAMAGGPSTTYGWHPAAQDQRLREIWNKAPVGTALTAETSDAQGLNQLAARGSGTALPIRGTTNEPVSAVTVNGQAAKITGGNRFEGIANVTAGNNTVTVAATDYGQPPNTATKQYQVTVAAGVSDSLSYDDSGNTLAGAGRTYEWDSLDRMTAVTVGAQRTEFLYDGLGRRRKITEKANGTVTSVKRLAYDGLDVAEERVDATNALTKRFFGTGMQVLTGADAGRYIYTRDHLGSIREAWKVESASVAVRYDYEPYGRRTKLVGGAFDADFGFTGHYTHAATGLVLSPTRPYEPGIARWLSRDPIGEAGGINLYGYVRNNPINLIDPLGLEDFRMFPPGETHKQYDSGPRTFDMGSHGDHEFVYDERKNPLSPQDLLNRVKDDPRFQNAKNVRIWACEVGQGKDSFAQRFADLSGKPTSGPNEIFWERGRNGTVAPTGPDGRNPPGGIGGFLGRMLSWNWRNFNPR